MKKLGKLSRLALALLAGGPALARAQVPVVPAAPAAAAPAAAVPATGVAAVPATGVAVAPQRNLWSFLCLNDVQKAKIRACFCGSQFGQLINNSMSPVSVFTGGVLPQPCPILDPADLLLPPDSALGAAAQVKKDTLEAAKRRAAIRYMSTADCNWWPEVQAALANSLRMDRNECVRLEAALALQRGCCCNPTTVKALVNALSPLPTDGNPPEDSPRVRAAAMVALDHCLHCYYGLAAAPPCKTPAPVPAPAPEELPRPRKEGPPPELPPPPPPPPPPDKGPVVQGEPPLRPVSAAGPARDASMEQLVQEAQRILQKAKEQQQAAIRAAAAKPQSLTELLEETFHTSPTQAAPLAAGQQTQTPPPTIFSPPERAQVVAKPSPAPTNIASAAVAARSVVAAPSAPKGNPSIAPVAANDAAPRDADVKTHSLTELIGDALHPSAKQAAPPSVGQQKPAPPPTIFSPPTRTQVVEKPTPTPSSNVAGTPSSVAPSTTPKENPSLAPTAASSAPPTVTPIPVAPNAPSVVPPSVTPTPPTSASPAPLPTVPSKVPTPSAAPTLPVSASPAPAASVASAPRSVDAPPTAPKGNPSPASVAASPASPDLTPAPVAPIITSVEPTSAAPKPTVSASPAPVRPTTLAEAASGAKSQPEKVPLSVQQAAAKTQPEKVPLSVQQTAATLASPQTQSAWQLLLLLRNSTLDNVRAHAASSLADHEKPTPAVVQALVSSAGADASSEVRLACLKTLLKLRVNDPALPSTLMRLQTDQDFRVRDAAKALHEQLQSRADDPTPRS